MRAGAAFFLAMAAAGCSFPDVTLEPADASTPLQDATPDTFQSPDTNTTPDGAGDTSPVDGNSPADATDANQPTGDGEAGSCDQDNDTYLAESTCGADDCDDTDPRANPGVTTYQTFPVTPTNNPLPGDWNCNHIVEVQFPENFSCANVTTNCNSASGFTDSPACGATGTFVTCMQPLLGSCQTSTTNGNVVQGCK